MDLKELLGEELAKQVQEKLGDKKLTLDTGTLVDTKSQDFAKQYMPRSVYNTDKQQLQAQLDERTSDLESLKEQAKGGEALKTKITELEDKYKTRDKEAKDALEKQQRRHAVELELIKQGCDAPELIAPLIDTSKLIELGEGNYSGMKELIEPVKEKYKNNFVKVVPNGGPTPPADPDNPTPTKHSLAELQQKRQSAVKKGDMLAAVRIDREIAQAKETQK